MLIYCAANSQQILPGIRMIINVIQWIFFLQLYIVIITAAAMTIINNNIIANDTLSPIIKFLLSCASDSVIVGFEILAVVLLITSNWMGSLELLLCPHKSTAVILASV